MSNQNLPDGVREGDPATPWNKAATRECRTCAFWRDNDYGGVCADSFDGAVWGLRHDSRCKGQTSAHWALSWVMDHMSDGVGVSCDRWQEA